MESFTVNLNPTPILILDYPEPIVSKNEIDILLYSNKFVEHAKDSVQVSKSTNVIRDSNIYNLKEKFDAAIEHYLINLLKVSNKFSMTHSWLTRNSMGSNHETHDHPNIMLSAVAYFNEFGTYDTFSNLNFVGSGIDHIFPNFKFNLNINELNDINADNYFMPTTSNRIIVFPGNMKHFSSPNESERMRYCLGTNYFLNDIINNDPYSSFKISLETTNFVFGN